MPRPTSSLCPPTMPQHGAPTSNSAACGWTSSCVAPCLTQAVTVYAPFLSLSPLLHAQCLHSSGRALRASRQRRPQWHAEEGALVTRQPTGNPSLECLTGLAHWHMRLHKTSTCVLASVWDALTGTAAMHMVASLRSPVGMCMGCLAAGDVVRSAA